MVKPDLNGVRCIMRVAALSAAEVDEAVVGVGLRMIHTRLYCQGIIRVCNSFEHYYRVSTSAANSTLPAMIYHL